MTKFLSLTRVLAGLCSMALALGVLFVPSAASAATQTLSVNFSGTETTIGGYGRGFLSGINPDFPGQANTAPLKPTAWRLGDPAYIPLNATPPYDYFSVYPAVKETGATTIQAIASDFIQAAPYDSMTWFDRCEALASRAAGLGEHPQWDLLNEPDGNAWTWQSTGTTNWDQCYDGIKAGDSTALIAGPSITYPTVNDLKTFLTNQKSKGRLPDVLTWHFSTPASLESDVAQLRAHMTSIGMPVIPIFVNEVMFTGEVPHPGQAIAYFAAAERAKVTLGHACWTESGLGSGYAAWTCDQPMLDGILDVEQNRRAQWYAYANYAAMSGNLVPVTGGATAEVDGLASKSADRATVLIGANDDFAGGTVNITLNGLGGLSFLSGSTGTVRVASQSLSAGYGPATQSSTQADAVISYTNGTASISLPLPQYGALRLTITASTGSLYDSAWSNVGGIVTDSPEVVSTGGGDLLALVRGQDGALYVTSYSGSTWASWSGGSWNGTAGALGGPTGGKFLGAPSAVSWGGKVTVAVRGIDNAMWTRTLSGGSWGPWTSVGGTLTSSPTLASQNSTNVEAFWRASNKHLYGSTFNGTSWSAATDLDGPSSGTFKGDPTAVSRVNGVITVYVQASDGSVQTRYWTTGGGWSTGWVSLGGIVTSSPSAAAQSSASESVFARGQDGALYRLTWNGSWSSWTKVGTGGPSNGVFTGTPAVVGVSSTRIDLLVWSADGPVYHLITN